VPLKTITKKYKIPLTVVIAALCVVIIFGVIPRAHAAITSVQSRSTTTSSATSLALAFTSNITAGNAIIVTAVQPFGLTATAIHDSLGNTYSEAGFPITTDSSKDVGIFYALNVTGGADTITFNDSCGPCAMSMVIAEFSGILGFDNATGNAATFPGDTSPNSTSLTPSVSGELLIGALTQDSYPTVTPDAGFTNIATVGNATPTFPDSTEYQILSSTSAISASYTLGTAATWAIEGALFTPQGGGGGGGGGGTAAVKVRGGVNVRGGVKFR
jgi:hypothetical protein